MSASLTFAFVFLPINNQLSVTIRRIWYNVIVLSYILREGLIMDYVTLLKNGADEAELQSHLSQGNEATITVRVPQNLKDACSEIAALRGMNMSTYVRSCIIRDLTEKK